MKSWIAFWNILKKDLRTRISAARRASTAQASSSLRAIPILAVLSIFLSLLPLPKETTFSGPRLFKKASFYKS